MPSLEMLSKTPYKANVSVHDPSIVETPEGEYYIFGSHMEVARSEDLKQWTSVASGVSRNNPLFDNLFTERKAFDFVGRNAQGWYSVWAPDVIYNEVMGKYVMYFCTTSTYIKSSLCFATSDSIEGPYTYQDTILYSGFTPRDLGETNVQEILGEEDPSHYFRIRKYNNMLWPNAIDPALFTDEEGRMWMSYGSWSGGMFILEIDQETGYPLHPESDEETQTDRYFGRHIAGGQHNSIEGPYILYDEVSGYYYLFLSYGSLTRTGGYQIRLFRSENPDGPYLDAKGQDFHYVLAHPGYGIKLMGNYILPTLQTAYMAPGHNSALINRDGGIFLVHHTRFDSGSEYHEPRVRSLFRTPDGWLTAAPFAFSPGDSMEPAEVKKAEIAGPFYILNHGTKINSMIEEPLLVDFQRKGSVEDQEGNSLGSWESLKEEGGITLTLQGVSYSGVLFYQHDEAGNPLLAISAVSEENTSLWAVRYLQKKEK